MVKTTTNIYIGAAFLLQGAMLVNVDRSDLKHVMYSFQGENLDQVKTLFTTGRLFGDVQAYSRHILDLKQELRSD
jgi:hypothetical protein